MLGSIVPKSFSSKANASKRVFKRFSEDAGLVYFGYVSQRSDEHHIVRGFTVSTKHHDNHYCIGTYDDYDVIAVERSDKLRSGKDHVWHILEIDLKSATDLPHAFISSIHRTPGFHEVIETKYHTMLPHTPGAIHHYSSEFTSQFAMYTTPAHALILERIITPEDADLVSKHFKGLVIEITNDALYIYTEKAHVTEQLLMTMLTNGIWLAKQIDKNSRHII